MSDHLQSGEKEELYLRDYYAKLRVVGMDRKGQISTAYAQSGVALSLGLAFDFGAMLGPGVHLVSKLDVKGTRTAHALLTLNRAPRMMWYDPVAIATVPPGGEFKPPQADWTADRFYAMGFLRGDTWEFGADVAAEAFVGFGAAFDVDETGLTVGAKLEAGGSGLTTRLCDPNPGLYADYNTKLINDDLSGIFRDNTKKKAAAWLVEVGHGRKVAIADGVPIQTQSSLKRRLKTAGLNIQELTNDAANIWDTHQTATVNRQAGNWFSSTLSVLHGLGKKSRKALSGGGLKTKALLTDMNEARDQIAKLRDHCEREAEKLSRESQQAPHGTEFLYRLQRRANKASHRAAKKRLAEADGLIKLLERARDLKHFNTVAADAAAPEVPRFFLDVNMVEGHVATELSAQMVLPKALGRNRSFVPSLHATVSGKAFTKRIGSRFQSYVLGGGADRHMRTLFSTQDAVVTYNSRIVKGSIGSTRHSASGEKSFNLITMSYRAVIANWFDDGAHKHKALPNGSGVSFGMSILQSRIKAYADACKPLSDAQIQADADFGTDIDRFEEVMRRQLRVPRKDLRRCFRNTPQNLLDEDRPAETYVIESSFAFTKAQDLTVQKHRPKNLMDLLAVKKLGNDGRSQDMTNTRLQVIRIRYRIQTDEDRTRNYFSLGWNPLIYKEDGSDIDVGGVVPFASKGNAGEDLDALAYYKDVQEHFDLKTQWNKLKENITDLPETGLDVPDLQAMVSVGLERVERVGTEGIVTLHEHLVTPFYPAGDFSERRIRHLTRKHDARNAELLMPPVKLFSQ